MERSLASRFYRFQGRKGQIAESDCSLGRLFSSIVISRKEKLVLK